MEQPLWRLPVHLASKVPPGFGTLRTQSIEISDLPLDDSVKIPDDAVTDSRRNIHIEIGYAPTGITDKMVMGTGIGIKMIHPVAHAQSGDLTQLGQQCQIAVNGPQTDIGEFVSQIAVYHVGRRVIPSGHQKIPDSFPLTAVFLRHTLLPFSGKYQVEKWPGSHSQPAVCAAGRPK